MMRDNPLTLPEPDTRTDDGSSGRPMSACGLSRSVVVPYVTAWSEEKDSPEVLVQRPGGGIAYVDETLADRDRHGVLWFRTPVRHEQGRPEFNRVHPIRQRRTMLRLLCQVCGDPADRTDDGVLWLLRDHRDDWPGWPNHMGVTEPPICLPCVHTSTRLCPALKRGAVTVRAKTYPIEAVHGSLYRGSPPVPVTTVTMPLNNPLIHWVRAVSLVRELNHCTIIPPTTLDTD